MNITEVLISYHAKNMSEYKTESKKPLTKNTKKSTAIMQNNKPTKKEKIPETIIVAPIKESEELLEEPIFGLESTNRSWASRLKEVNSAAYQNLKNWD